MQIRFFATFRQIVGGKVIELPLPDGATIGQLVDEVTSHYPGLRHELLDDDGQLYGHVHVFVNGRDVPYLENQMDTVLVEDDVISIFPAVGGG